MNRLLFGRPEMLWGLAAVVIPVVVHLFNRYRAKPVRFAAMDFLLRVKRRTARRMFFRQLILLLVRTLLLSLLVLAAADPFFSNRMNAQTLSPDISVFIIDRSFSMQARDASGKSRFESALEQAGQLVSDLRPGNRMCLVTAGDTIDVLVHPCVESGRIVREKLMDVQPGWGGGNLGKAVEKAGSLLVGESQARKRIILVTDGARHAWPDSFQWPIGEKHPEIVMHVVDPRGVRDNWSVARVEAVASGKYLEIRARFGSFSVPGTKKRGLARIVKTNQTLAQGFVELTSDRWIEKTFHVSQASLGVSATLSQAHSGRTAPRGLIEVEIEDDALPDDNRRLLMTPVGKPLRVLLINGDMRQVLHQDELFYLQHAFSAESRQGMRISFSTSLPEGLDMQKLEDVDVVILANIGFLSETAVSDLKKYVESGGGLLISVGDNIRVERFNASLGDLLPCPVRDVIDLRSGQSNQAVSQGMAFSDLRLDHPVMEMFADAKGMSLHTVRTWRAAMVELGASGGSANVLMRYANGSAALIESSRKVGRIMLFTSSLDSDWTSWPARASFLPFIRQTTLYLAGRGAQLDPIVATVGEVVRLEVPDEVSKVRIVNPKGIEYELGLRSNSDEQISFQQTELPGWYAVEPVSAGSHGPTIAGAWGFFVYPPTEESDLKLMTSKQAKQMFQNPEIFMGSKQPDRAGGSLVEILLFLAISLVMIEAWFVSRQA